MQLPTCLACDKRDLGRLLCVARLLFISANSPSSIQQWGKTWGEKLLFFFFLSQSQIYALCWSPYISSFTAVILYLKLCHSCWFCFLASFLQEGFFLSLALLGFLLPSSTAPFNSSHHVEERETYWRGWGLTQSRQDWAHFRCLLFSTLKTRSRIS